MIKPASFWESQHPEIVIDEPLRGASRVDVAIIGGGFTGLSAAREIKRSKPALSVSVFEAQYVGYGASGRNGGFNMTLFGLEPEITILRWGQQKTLEAQRYMIRAVEYVRELIEQYNLDSAYEHTGMVRVAYSSAQVKRLKNSMELFQKLGLGANYQFQPSSQIRQNIHSPRFQAGIFEKNSGILNPFKHVQELKRIAKNAGASIYERTPILKIEKSPNCIKLQTPDGIVICNRLVIATNAWSNTIRGLPRIRSRQAPVWTSQVVTQKLSEQQWDDIGWNQRQSVEDNRQLIHYFRRTQCGRLTMGGGNVAFPNKNTMESMNTVKIWKDLHEHIKWLFPSLKDIQIEHRWGGPVSVNLDMTPEIGFIGDQRIVYSTGCIGHGVSLTQLNGRTIADLVLENQTELTDFWIVNRKALAWPPGWAGDGVVRAISTGLKLWDALEERELQEKPDI